MRDHEVSDVRFEPTIERPKVDEGNVKETLARRREAYNRVLGNVSNPDVRIILEDLAVFCRLLEPTFHPNDRVSAMLDGRREVLTRIFDHARLNLDTLFELYHLRGARK